jgi:hypothetical protein
MEDITNDEKSFLEKSRTQTFRVYHVRTLATILKLIKSKKAKDAIEYINAEIYSIKSIKNNEFNQLIDAITLQLQLKDTNEGKTNSSP